MARALGSCRADSSNCPLDMDSCSSRALDMDTGKDNCTPVDIDSSTVSGRDCRAEADTILGSKVPDRTPGHRRLRRRRSIEIPERAVPGPNSWRPFLNSS
jgi:hypothetical protein